MSNQNVRRVPLALKADGTPWIWERHHTGIIGTTGSGKNSPLFSMIRQDEDLINQGLVKPYALISPKDAQLSRLSQSSLVDEFASNKPLEQLALIGKVYNLMMERINYQLWEASLKPEEYELAKAEGRIRVLSPKTLMIDEYSSVFKKISKMIVPGVRIETQNKNGDLEMAPATAQVTIDEIFSQGRSALVYVVIAAQEFIQEYIGRRTNFQYWIFLRIAPAQSSWVDLAFGEGSREEGIRPHEIPNLPNNASGGIAFVKSDDGGSFSRVRFPFTSKEDVDALMARNRVEVPYEGPTEFSSDL